MLAKNSTALGLVMLMAKPCQKALHQPRLAAPSSSVGPCDGVRHSARAEPQEIEAAAQAKDLVEPGRRGEYRRQTEDGCRAPYDAAERRAETGGQRSAAPVPHAEP